MLDDLGGIPTPGCDGALPVPGDATPAPTEEAGYAPRVVCQAFHVAVDTDEEFVSDAGGLQEAADYAVILVAASNTIYTREVGMGLRLSYLRIWNTTDPWNGLDTASQLSEFASYWATNMGSVPRASAHLFSGRNIGGGIAYVRAVCRNDYGYAVSANMVGSFPFPIVDNASGNWDLMVVAHEWGHQFGTGHTHNACEYSPIIDGCGLRPTSSSCEQGAQDCSVAAARQGSIMSYCHTCSGGMSNVKMTFGSRVAGRMGSYLSGLSCGTMLDVPTFTAIAANPGAAVCGGVPVTLTAIASGAELRFQWYRNGTRVTGANGPTFIVAAPVNNDRWDVVVYSACGVIDTRGTSLGVVLTIPASGATLNGSGANLVSDAAGNANGVIDSGESGIAVTIPVVNAGPSAATGVVATLASNTPTVSVIAATASYPDLVACSGVGSNPVPFVIELDPSHRCGDPISLTLSISAAQGSGSYTFSLPTGRPGSVAAPVTIAYAGSVVPIPDNHPAGATARLQVAGLAGTIVDVDVRFDGSACNADPGSTTVGLDHTWVSDLSFYLTSPAGTTVTLMSYPGGVENGGHNFCGTRLDDSATVSIQSIAASDNPWTGTFAPAMPLAAFNGESPNGEWALRVVDTGPADVGSIRDFSLIVTVLSPATCDPVCARPAFTRQPTSNEVCAGSSITFTAAATGATAYQWRKNGTNIPGATASSFTIPAAFAADAATYACVATNACGSSTSSAATLTVTGVPVITSQPISVATCPGGSVAFQIVAT
ncbi:MAG: M12 family metallo-peptidase, partial [Phycisphaerae bacterium]